MPDLHLKHTLFRSLVGFWLYCLVVFNGFLSSFYSVQQATAALCILSSLYAFSAFHLLSFDGNDLCDCSSLFK